MKCVFVVRLPIVFRQLFELTFLLIFDADLMSNRPEKRDYSWISGYEKTW